MQKNLLFLNSIVYTSINTTFFYFIIGINRMSPYIHTYVVIYVTSIELEYSDETKWFSYNFAEPVCCRIFFLSLLCSSTLEWRLYECTVSDKMVNECGAAG
jgi:hypothetical protein